MNNNDVEIWKEINIENFSKYEISTFGRIRNKNNPNHIMKQRLNASGYWIISLYNDNAKAKTFSVHRLVALTFIPNPNNLPQVNHKDESPLNPRMDNLEWCTPKYNSNYGNIKEKQRKAKEGMYFGEDNPMWGKHHSEKTKKKMSEVHYDCNGGKNPRARKVFYKGIIYSCIKECAKAYNVSYFAMMNYLNGKTKNMKNFDTDTLKYYDKERN